MTEDPEDDFTHRAPSTPKGSSPYATGGGGVTFERKVAAKFLADMLVGTSVGEVTRGRKVVRVAFQQEPFESVDDIVLSAALPSESVPSLVIALAVRRSPNLVQSDKDSQRLVRQLVQGLVADTTGGPDHRLGLVVAGPQSHAKEMAQLADVAAGQADAHGFFRLVTTDGKYSATLRKRLDHIRALVKQALVDLGTPTPSHEAVEERSWQLLSNLDVLMPRLESPDETDWTGIQNTLTAVVPDADSLSAIGLRDRLLALANDYAPRAAQVDLPMLRRAAHGLLDDTKRHHPKAWRVLDDIQARARDSLDDQITAPDGRSVRLDRSAEVKRLRDAVADAQALVVSGASGVGKSALAVLGFASMDAEPDGSQTVVVNLRQLPEVGLSLEAALGESLSSLLSELSAPQRTLIVDGAEAAAEGREDAFRYLVSAARESDVGVVAVTATDTKQIVVDCLGQRLGTSIVEFEVPSLTDVELEQLIGTFSELRHLFDNPRSRELLRRLVVTDLLVRAGGSGTPLTDADAMNEIWANLVRKPRQPDRGLPVARETAMLNMAKLELTDGDRLDVVGGLDPTALEGLERDGLLRRPADDPFKIGPEFAHDELRRYAVARLLLLDGAPAATLLQADAPRWTLSAARIACQALLALPNTATTPLKGRFGTQQDSFDKLVDAGHGTRWGDVPGEALLALPDYEELLADAWPELVANDTLGLKRLARLVDQRFRNDRDIIDVAVAAPIVAQLLETSTPWQSDEYVQRLLRDWLRALAIAFTSAGQPLRIRLGQQLVEACAAAERRHEADRTLAHRGEQHPPRSAVALALAARLQQSSTLLQQRLGIRHSTRRRREVPWEIKQKVVVEFLALLGPDLGDDGEAILDRLADDAPAFLGPAVDDRVSALALASRRPGLLIKLTEAYYIDDERARFEPLGHGIRRHIFAGLGMPFAAWYYGPFEPLLRADFHNGVALLNRLLNHAAVARITKLDDIDRRTPWNTQDASRYLCELTLEDERRRYVGDSHVWHWYRGNAVGPYPCVSALQALERVCEELIETGVPIGNLMPILLDGCESLAMVGLALAILVRHAEDADRLLDPFMAEPMIWHLEFHRASQEASGMATVTEGLPKLERRKWSLREVAMSLVVRAEGDRIEELQSVGDTLKKNARRLTRGAKRRSKAQSPFDVELDFERLVDHARVWASTLDRSTYQAHIKDDALVIETMPSQEIAEALESDQSEADQGAEAVRLFVKYHVRPSTHGSQPIPIEELVADLDEARKLLDSPPTLPVHNPLDLCALVSAAVLNAHFVTGHSVPDDALHFAAELLLQIGEASPVPQDVEGMLNDSGADRSASRALPLLLLPAANGLRAVLGEGTGAAALERIVQAGVNLAQTLSYEVRLQLARGLDQLWKSRCDACDGCHHEAGLRLATETIRYCALGSVDPETGARPSLRLEDPLGDAIKGVTDDALVVSRLDGAIRALAPAAIDGICVSAGARELLHHLLAAQRRSLLAADHRNPDWRGTHTLVSARALLALGEHGDDGAILQHIDAYADHSYLLHNLLRALSAAAEEVPERAATARRVWPHIMRRVLKLHDAGRKPSGNDRHYGSMALASLIPIPTDEVAYLYREIDGKPIIWWSPEALQPEVELWLAHAAGDENCISQLVFFLGALPRHDQALIGLPWIKRIVVLEATGVAVPALGLTHWLIDVRTDAADVGLLKMWQAIVDALVVAGVRQLAPYSD